MVTFGGAGELTLIVLGLLLMGFVSSKLVRSLNYMSYYVKMPKFILSFIVLGLGTSLPDLFIAGFGAASGQLPLVLGEIIGANILVLTLILGSVTVLKGGFTVREKTVLENFGWIFFVLMIPFFLLIDGRLTTFEGVVLILVYVMYVYNVAEQERTTKTLTLEDEAKLGVLPPQFHYRKRALALTIGKALFFLAVLLIAANFVVENAIGLSAHFGVPEIFVGITVLALGVTLPELALNLSALRAREHEIIWGDLIGSFVTELTLVLGVAALFTGGAAEFVFDQTIVGYAFMAISFLLVFFFATTKKSLSKAQGVALILLYVVFITLQIDFALAGQPSILGGVIP